MLNTCVYVGGEGAKILTQSISKSVWERGQYWLILEEVGHVS